MGSQITVPPEQAGWRLDRALASHPELGSRKKAANAIAMGKVSLDGQPVTPAQASQPVTSGSVLEVDWQKSGTTRAGVQAGRALRGSGVQVLYEDDDIVVVDKPPGLLTDTATKKQARDRDSLKQRLRTYLRPHRSEPFIVHRIDRDTSGVVVVAKNEAASEALFAQFRARSPLREYLAVVMGQPRPDQGTWADWLAWDALARQQRVVGRETPGAVWSTTHYEVLQRGPREALITLRLESGRRNQIRVQAAVRGHPLVGERQYLPATGTGSRRRFPRQALHARSVRFLHPVTQVALRVEAPIPHDLRRLIQQVQEA